MESKGLVEQQFNEISRHYFIPPEIEPILINALSVRTGFEDAFDELEKETLRYIKLKFSLDQQIEIMVSQCQKK